MKHLWLAGSDGLASILISRTELVRSYCFKFWWHKQKKHQRCGETVLLLAVKVKKNLTTEIDLTRITASLHQANKSVACAYMHIVSQCLGSVQSVCLCVHQLEFRLVALLLYPRSARRRRLDVFRLLMSPLLVATIYLCVVFTLIWIVTYFLSMSELIFPLRFLSACTSWCHPAVDLISVVKYE